MRPRSSGGGCWWLHAAILFIGTAFAVPDWATREFASGGLRHLPQIGDGNCLFRAILAGCGIDPANHAKLRAAAVAQLKQERAKYYFDDSDAVADAKIANVALLNEWAGEAEELSAIVDLTGAELRVHVIVEVPNSPVGNIRVEEYHKDAYAGLGGLQPVQQARSPAAIAIAQRAGLDLSRCPAILHVSFVRGNHYDTLIPFAPVAQGQAQGQGQGKPGPAVNNVVNNNGKAVPGSVGNSGSSAKLNSNKASRPIADADLKGVDAFLRVLCADTAAADYLMRLLLSGAGTEHANGANGAGGSGGSGVEALLAADGMEGLWDLDSLLSEEDTPHLSAEAVQAASRLLTHGWCSTSGRADTAPIYAPVLSHIVFRASQHILLTTSDVSALRPSDAANNLDDGDGADEFATQRRRGRLDDNQLALMVRRAVRMLLQQAAGDASSGSNSGSSGGGGSNSPRISQSSSSSGPAGASAPASIGAAVRAYRKAWADSTEGYLQHLYPGRGSALSANGGSLLGGPRQGSIGQLSGISKDGSNAASFHVPGDGNGGIGMGFGAGGGGAFGGDESRRRNLRSHSVSDVSSNNPLNKAVDDHSVSGHSDTSSNNPLNKAVDDHSVGGHSDTSSNNPLNKAMGQHSIGGMSSIQGGSQQDGQRSQAAQDEQSRRGSDVSLDLGSIKDEQSRRSSINLNDAGFNSQPGSRQGSINLDDAGVNSQPGSRQGSINLNDAGFNSQPGSPKGSVDLSDGGFNSQPGSRKGSMDSDAGLLQQLGGARFAARHTHERVLAHARHDADAAAEQSAGSQAGADAAAASAATVAALHAAFAELHAAALAGELSADDVDMWQQGLLDTSLSGSAATEAAAAVAPALIQNLVDAFVGLSMHPALDHIHRAYGSLLAAAACSPAPLEDSLSALMAQLPEQQRIKRNAWECTPAEQLALARLFASMVLPALHDFAFSPAGDALAADGKSNAWDMTNAATAQATSQLLFGMQLVLLQVSDPRSVQDMPQLPFVHAIGEGKAAAALSAGTGPLPVTGAPGTGKQQLDPFAPAKGATPSASPSRAPHTRSPSQQIEMLRAALKGGAAGAVKHSGPMQLMLKLGLATQHGGQGASKSAKGKSGHDDGVSQSSSTSKSKSLSKSLDDTLNLSGPGEQAYDANTELYLGVTLTRDFVDLVAGAGSRIAAALLPNSRALPAPPPCILPGLAWDPWEAFPEPEERRPGWIKLSPSIFMPAIWQDRSITLSTALWLPPAAVSGAGGSSSQLIAPSAGGSRGVAVGGDEAALEAIQGNTASLGRYFLLLRMAHSLPPGEAAQRVLGVDSAPTMPPVWLHAAAMVAFARQGYDALYTLGTGVPVIKYSQDKSTLTDWGKWQERLLRVSRHGIAYADAGATARSSRTAQTRQLLHSSTTAILLPAPRPALGIDDAALKSIAARAAEGRLCGVIATGDTKRRRSYNGEFIESLSPAEADPWRVFDALPSASPSPLPRGQKRPAAAAADVAETAYVRSDAAQFLAPPDEHTRFYAFCTRSKVPPMEKDKKTGRDAKAAERGAWLLEAQALAAAFCSAAHDGGIIVRARLEQWWNIQVARAASGSGAALRASVSADVAATLQLGGLGRLDCHDLFSHRMPVKASAGAGVHDKKMAAALVEAVPYRDFGAHPPDVFVPGTLAAGGRSTDMVMGKLRAVGRRLGAAAHWYMSQTATNTLVKEGRSPGFELQQLQADAKGAAKPAKVADQVFWGVHARMASGGRAVETTISESTVVALWVAYHGAIPTIEYEDPAQAGQRGAKMKESRPNSLYIPEHLRAKAGGYTLTRFESEHPDQAVRALIDRYTAVYIDDATKLVVISFRGGADKKAGFLLWSNRMKSDYDRWVKGTREGIERVMMRFSGYSIMFTGYCMGAHMAMLASEAFRAPAILFNPAPRVNMAGKLYAAAMLAAPLKVVHFFTGTLSRRLINGMNDGRSGFARILAMRTGSDYLTEFMDWNSRQVAQPGNGMMTVYSIAGDMIPGSYYNPRKRDGSVGNFVENAADSNGYDLHLWPSVLRRNQNGAHTVGAGGLLPLRRDDEPADRDAIRFPQLHGVKGDADIDAEDVTMDYVAACLKIYDGLLGRTMGEGYQDPVTNKRVNEPLLTSAKRGDAHKRAKDAQPKRKKALKEAVSGAAKRATSA